MSRGHTLPPPVVTPRVTTSLLVHLGEEGEGWLQIVVPAGLRLPSVLRPSASDSSLPERYRSLKGTLGVGQGTTRTECGPNPGREPERTTVKTTQEVRVRVGVRFAIVFSRLKRGGKPTH